MTANEYNECVRNLSDRLFRFALSHLPNVMDAEDVVQQVFERFWTRHPEVEFAAAKTYLFTSVHRACIDYFRRKKTTGNTTEWLEVHDQQINGDHLENRQLMEELLKHLNHDQRTLLVMRDYEGYSYKEIAEILNLTESQVKINLFRIRRKLQFFLTSNLV